MSSSWHASYTASTSVPGVTGFPRHAGTAAALAPTCLRQNRHRRPLGGSRGRSSGQTGFMHGQHARPASTPFGQPFTSTTPLAGQASAKHARPGRLAGRTRRRILAYRAIDFLSTHIPEASGPGEECLLLVHIRHVVGQVHYRLCSHCAQGVITNVVINEPFRSSDLGTRALSHLRTRHPGITWTNTSRTRTPRDLLRRMRIPTSTRDEPCAHTRQPLAA